MRTPFNNFLRRTLNIGNGLSSLLQNNAGTLLIGIKGVKCLNFILIYLIRCTSVSQKRNQGTVSAVAADNRAIAQHGAVINTNASNNIIRHCWRHPSQIFINLQIAIGQLHHGKTSFGYRTSFIAKKNAQTACCFQTVNFANQNIVFSHLQALERKQDRSKHRQALRHCTNNNGNRHGYGIHNQTYPLVNIPGQAAAKQGFGNNTNHNTNCAHVAKRGYLLS